MSEFKQDGIRRRDVGSSTVSFVDGAIPAETSIQYTYYNANGNAVKKEDKAVARKGGGTLHIKISKVGAARGKPYDPYSIYSGETDLSDVDKQRGTLKFDWKLVDKTTYDNYMKYLKSKDKTFLKVVERGVIDG